MKKYLIIKMAPHFGTYHWSKKMLRGTKNTVQGAKMAFGTPFLATCIGVALSRALFHIKISNLKVKTQKNSFVNQSKRVLYTPLKYLFTPYLLSKFQNILFTPYSISSIPFLHPISKAFLHPIPPNEFSDFCEECYAFLNNSLSFFLVGSINGALIY